MNSKLEQNYQKHMQHKERANKKKEAKNARLIQSWQNVSTEALEFYLSKVKRKTLLCGYALLFAGIPCVVWLIVSLVMSGQPIAPFCLLVVIVVASTTGILFFDRREDVVIKALSERVETENQSQGDNHEKAEKQEDE